LDTIKTGNNIDTVKKLNLKFQITLNAFTSNHLSTFIVTGILFNPTSKKTTIDNIVVIITELQVIICEPVIPIFLPKNPEAIEPNKGKNIITKYIIYIVLQYFLLIYKMLLKYLNLLQILLLL